MEEQLEDTRWALVLGASSGFGGAVAVALAEAGFNICGVHLDMRSRMARRRGDHRAHRGHGPRGGVLQRERRRRREAQGRARRHGEASSAGDGFRVLLHSLAFGTLLPFVQAGAGETPDQPEADGHDARRDGPQPGLLDAGLRRAQPAAARQPHPGDDQRGRQPGHPELRRRLGGQGRAGVAHPRNWRWSWRPRGITANAILAGVTDTPALRRIPGNDKIVEGALSRNPSGRLTTPADIARFIVMWAGPGSQWATGNVLQVDGGEEIVA